MSGATFVSDAKQKQEGRDVELSEKEQNISRILEKMATRKGTLLTSFAQAYVTIKGINKLRTCTEQASCIR